MSLTADARRLCPDPTPAPVCVQPATGRRFKPRDWLVPGARVRGPYGGRYVLARDAEGWLLVQGTRRYRASEEQIRKRCAPVRKEDIDA